MKHKAPAGHRLLPSPHDPNAPDHPLSHPLPINSAALASPARIQPGTRAHALGKLPE